MISDPDRLQMRLIARAWSEYRLVGGNRRIPRWEHEAVLEAMQDRLDRQPQIMRLRRETAEHPFGTLKLWMGAAHFLTRTLQHVRTEMSLHVLAYNLKRVMRILGVGQLMKALAR